MSEHTPGPWVFMYDSIFRRSGFMEAAPGITIGAINHTEPICRVSGYLMPLESNAGLIKAAPDLLEAAKTQRAFEEHLEFGCVNGCLNGESCQWGSEMLLRAKAQRIAAIAKAEGKS